MDAEKNETASVCSTDAEVNNDISPEAIPQAETKEMTLRKQWSTPILEKIGPVVGLTWAVSSPAPPPP